jgi:hypothetical protein
MVKLETAAYATLAIMYGLFAIFSIAGSYVPHEVSSAFVQTVTDFYMDLPTSRYRIGIGLVSSRIKSEPFFVPIALLICYAVWGPYILNRFVYAVGLIVLFGIVFWGVSALTGSALFGYVLFAMALSAGGVAVISHCFPRIRLPLTAFLCGCAAFGAMDIYLAMTGELGWVGQMFLAIFQFMSATTAGWVASIDYDEGDDNLFTLGISVGKSFWFPIAIGAPVLFFALFPVFSQLEDNRQL